MTISNTDDVIDSRDVIERIEHLRQLRQPGPVDLGDEDDAQAQDDLFAELAALEKLAEEASDYAPDWEYGEALIGIAISRSTRKSSPKTLARSSPMPDGLTIASIGIEPRVSSR